MRLTGRFPAATSRCQGDTETRTRAWPLSTWADKPECQGTAARMGLRSGIPARVRVSGLRRLYQRSPRPRRYYRRIDELLHHRIVLSGSDKLSYSSAAAISARPSWRACSEVFTVAATFRRCASPPID
jgi:hypothetical protein